MQGILEEDKATGTAKELYDEIKESLGMVPNFFKAMAAVDPIWAKTNWERAKHIMLKEGALDRKTKEIIAFVVSLMNKCEYCHMAHKAMALMNGVTEDELQEAIMVMELFQSFNTIATSLQVPCDISQ
ncbi:4-carboxymuconolactone decarboxylase domain/alkylhydroperoxidase AhpD family core domain protein [Dissulfuribacter thermophilus]|uniref:4-carboxymuconolactone decarboxylase domain/alkylhydroperoxidase AhpD family core domain protein n=1 Tax=Dissulfuribacter thermophilus TaxID=1156395 RepID=A0A1B9F4L2_9BACT|nr:carboxymuconolactone decarboxylase family protein [Dissulfuribacter thermophilus]OCC14870.1 4-carboxymuconolactone decarboxylase domain/alkylhydroperoxidase AhpD family core domain protein [Dissulfuribacter thermophilus]